MVKYIENAINWSDNIYFYVPEIESEINRIKLLKEKNNKEFQKCQDAIAKLGYQKGRCMFAQWIFSKEFVDRLDKNFEKNVDYKVHHLGQAGFNDIEIIHPILLAILLNAFEKKEFLDVAKKEISELLRLAKKTSIGEKKYIITSSKWSREIKTHIVPNSDKTHQSRCEYYIGDELRSVLMPWIKVLSKSFFG